MSDGADRREARRFNMTLPLRVLSHDSWARTLRADARRQLPRIVLPCGKQLRYRQRDDIQMAVSASGATLTKLHGLGVLTAGKILSRVGDAIRFRSAAAFATYTGTAPIEVSSGDVVRHRLSRAGDRQLNFCLHVMAMAQVRSTPMPPPTTCGNDPKAKVGAKQCAA